jgi:hypothetical protein
MEELNRTNDLTLILQGGLGNQLFQYCACKAFSAAHNFRLVLGAIASLKEKQPLLQAFLVPDKFVSVCKPSLINRIGLKLLHLNEDVSPKLLGHLGILSEKSFAEAVSLSLVQNKDYTAAGYFQSENYFKSLSKEEICAMFSFRIVNTDMVNACSKLIKQGNFLSIHLRRGDYLAEQNKLVHPCLPLSYYYHAYQLITSLTSIDGILIFSDTPEHHDIELLGNYLNNSNRIIVSSLGLHAHEELYLMSMCTNHIIANSTFSWWGAYLSGLQKESIIIAPLHWYTRNMLKKKDHTDLYPSSWIILPSL